MSKNDPLIGQQLGDYKIIDVLGQGGMARVYRGYDEKLERYSAVKVFDTHLVASEDLDEYRARFQREARAIARLRHPQIVSVYQFGQIDNLHYMAMVFIDGRDLRYILKEHAIQSTRMTYIDMLRITADVAGALDYAHREGVIHRDVKPSNIMVTADGHAVLTDFGLALSIPEGTIGTTFGSVHYIAPEQAVSSAQAVPQSDLYSLGVILYEILTGKVPFDDASAMSVALKHLSDPPPPPSLFNPEIKLDLESVILRTLDKEPHKRYQDGMSLIQALEIALGMTDEDEVTRKLMALPDWAINPELAIFKNGAGKPDSKPSNPPAAIARGDANTISDKSAPAGFSQSGKPSPSQISSRYWNIGVIAILLLVVVVGFLVFSNLSPASPSETSTPAPTAAQPAALAVSQTPVETDITTAASATPAAPNQTAIDAVLTGTETSESESVTPAPTSTRRQTPSRSPTPTPTASVLVPSPMAESTLEPGNNNPNAQVELVYDDTMLVLFNRSDDVIDISDLSFVQVNTLGRALIFRADSWEGGSQPPANLPPNDCFQVWIAGDSSVPKPDFCGTRHAWSLVSAPRWFWISSVESATFDVRRGDEVLVTCAIKAGRCFVDLNGSPE